MPLTRPLINNLNTNVEIFNESMTVLHGNSTQANVDIGFVMNRAMGLVPNSAFYWNEGSQSFYFAMTANAGITYSNITPSSYANVTVGNVLFVNGAGLYVNGSLGTAGQVLGSNGAALSWVSGGGFTGGTISNPLTINNTAVSTSTTTGALIVTGGAGIAGDVNIGGNISASNFLGNIFFGPTPTTTYYTQAPLNLTNSLAGGIKTQLNLINTGGGGGAGAGIDFYTYTSVAGSTYPEARIAVVDDGNYSGYITLQTKIPGNTGANALAERLKIDSAGNLVIPTTTTSISTTTGALVVKGGVGVGGDTYIGGNVFYGAVSILNGSSTTTSIGTTPKSIDSFATAIYRGAKYLISTTDVTNTQYQMAEVILTQDGTNVGISVYGISYTGASSRMTFTANITSGTLTLWGTGVSANNTVKLQRTLIPA